MFAHTVQVSGLMHNDHLGVCLQACQHLFGALAIGNEEELERSGTHGQEGEVVVLTEAHENGVGVLLACPCRSIYNEGYFGAFFG